MRNQNISNTVWAVVPLKSPATAKSRLRAGLNNDARRRLMFAMARQVVRTLVRTPGIAGVAVVTASAEVAAYVEQDGAAVIRQDRDAGTAEACRAAVTHLSAISDSVLMISGDIPLISVDAVSTLLSLSLRTPLVTIVPDRRRIGTNALLCAPPAIIPPCFGSNSFQQHVAAARSQGTELCIVESDALSLDIDDLEDLDELRRRLDVDPTLLPVELHEAVSSKQEVPAQ